MKLLTKLTLFITFSKLFIVVLFVLLLPSLVNYVSFEYSNYYLEQQKKKVLKVIDENSLDYYLQGDSAYGSYTMLKEEYISIVPFDKSYGADTIETSQRIVDGDTLNYRVLLHHLKARDNKYILEIGKTTATIGQYNLLLQRFTLYTLIGLILLSIVIDLIYTRVLLKPLSKIVSTKLLNHKFPFKDPLIPVKTSTTDFKYLDSSLINLMEKIHDAFFKEREFTSNASHELMTPISILQTNLETLMIDEGLTEPQQDQLAGMMNTVNRLKKIVHALLHISRIENEQYAKNDTVQLNEMIIEIKEALSARLENKSISFKNKLNYLPEINKVNHDLIYQLLTNLINNAIRYNITNGIIIITDEWEAGQSYKLFIKDTGIGIKPEDQKNIFNRFKKSLQTEGEGYGLGLSIVKTIIQFHGFEISLQSAFGNGTVFCITIPAAFIKI